MSDRDLAQLLQECLAAYDAGLSPEECLSAYPLQKAALEPLMRKALSLRVAYATLPRPERREEIKQRFLFAAGRDVVQVLQSKPEAEFVSRSRERFLRKAGATTQEALREVPPPRLPFWANTRSHLLQAASSTQPVKPARQTSALAMRFGLSMIGMAVAVALAVMAFVVFQGQPVSVSADLNLLEQQIIALEQQKSAGQPIASEVLVELAARTYELSQKLSSQETTPEDNKKLDAIIGRQLPLVQSAAASSTEPPAALQQAQAQLNQASYLLAVHAEPTKPPTSAADASVTPIITAAATRSAPTSTPAALADGQIQLTPLLTDTTAGLAWLRVRSSQLSLSVPAGWTLAGSEGVSDGVVAAAGNFALFQGQGLLLVVNVRTGQMDLIIAGQVMSLRSSGSAGQSIGLEAVISLAGDQTPALWHVLQSLTFAAPASTATPNPTATPSATPTASPTATSTPGSGLTPTATP